mgnify:CR=1 FL=1
MSHRHLVALLLALSAINLALMIPGGFVETRDFSAYPASVLAAFNIFLTVLGLGSLVIGLAVARGQNEPQALWELSRIDETWQEEQWGEDEEAQNQTALKRAAFLHAAEVWRLSEDQ